VAQIASEALVQRLIDWKIDTVFGLPGDGINGIMEGLRRHSDKVRFVLVHHEEAAAFMATAHRTPCGGPPPAADAAGERLAAAAGSSSTDTGR
jgi:pyruvate dehydrogenase (quinone)